MARQGLSITSLAHSLAVGLGLLPAPFETNRNNLHLNRRCLFFVAAEIFKKKLETVGPETFLILAGYRKSNSDRSPRATNQDPSKKKSGKGSFTLTFSAKRFLLKAILRLKKSTHWAVVVAQLAVWSLLTSMVRMPTSAINYFECPSLSIAIKKKT